MFCSFCAGSIVGASALPDVVLFHLILYSSERQSPFYNYHEAKGRVLLHHTHKPLGFYGGCMTKSVSKIRRHFGARPPKSILFGAGLTDRALWRRRSFLVEHATLSHSLGINNSVWCVCVRELYSLCLRQEDGANRKSFSIKPKGRHVKRERVYLTR